jgi:hypothetical protein
MGLEEQYCSAGRLACSCRQPAHATIVGDLTTQGVLSQSSFDCIVLTETLQFVPRAIAALHGALRPGGVLLATMPGIRQLRRTRLASSCCWGAYACLGLATVCHEFPNGELAIEPYGNIFAATAQLQGVALEKVPHAT